MAQVLDDTKVFRMLKTQVNCRELHKDIPGCGLKAHEAATLLNLSSWGLVSFMTEERQNVNVNNTISAPGEWLTKWQMTDNVKQCQRIYFGTKCELHLQQWGLSWGG